MLVGAALIAPLWRKDLRVSFNGLTAILAASSGAKVIKSVWHEQRPNGQNDNSFPSQHSGDCFAAATVLHRRWRNKAGPVAIGLATAVSLARVFSGKHHVVDILAGASLGILAGEFASDYRERSSSFGPDSLR